MNEHSMNLNISIADDRSEQKSYRFSAKINDQEIGHVYCYLIKNDLHDAPYALVEDLAVSEAYRGKGVARMLMEALRSRANKEHCYKIIANSHEKRDAARALYLSLGYHAHATEFRLELP
jgi:GNAT superfamily N-acetyltransferase